MLAASNFDFYTLEVLILDIFKITEGILSVELLDEGAILPKSYTQVLAKLITTLLIANLVIIKGWG